VCWKATAQEIETREKRGAALKSQRAEKASEKGTSASRGQHKSTTAQTTLA